MVLPVNREDHTENICRTPPVVSVPAVCRRPVAARNQIRIAYGKGSVMRVVVDRGRCTGVGICESIAGDVFEIRDDGSVALLREDLGEERREEIHKAVVSCPTEAIWLAD